MWFPRMGARSHRPREWRCRPSLEWLEPRDAPAHDLTISSAATVGVEIHFDGAQVTFTAIADDANLNVADLLAQASDRRRVTVHSGNTGSQSGTITILAPIAIDGTGLAVLTIRTGALPGMNGSILVHAPILGDHLDLALVAGGEVRLFADLDAGSGLIYLHANDTIHQDATTSLRSRWLIAEALRDVDLESARNETTFLTGYSRLGAFRFQAASAVIVEKPVGPQPGVTAFDGQVFLHVRGLTIVGGLVNASNGAIDVDGDVNLVDGKLVAPRSDRFTVEGNWNRLGGLFDANQGTVIFDGFNQAVTGETTFHGFTKITPHGTLAFEAGMRQTFLGTLTLRGADCAPLHLRSTDDGSAWFIDAWGPHDLVNLTVRDGWNDRSDLLRATFSVDRGNLVGWEFPAFACRCGCNRPIDEPLDESPTMPPDDEQPPTEWQPLDEPSDSPKQGEAANLGSTTRVQVLAIEEEVETESRMRRPILARPPVLEGDRRQPAWSVAAREPNATPPGRVVPIRQESGSAAESYQIVGLLLLERDGVWSWGDSEVTDRLVVLEQRVADRFVLVAQTRTDYDGAYAFKGLTPGEYRVRLVLPYHLVADVGEDGATVRLRGRFRAAQQNFGLRHHLPVVLPPSEQSNLPPSNDWPSETTMASDSTQAFASPMVLAAFALLAARQRSRTHNAHERAIAAVAPTDGNPWA